MDGRGGWSSNGKKLGAFFYRNWMSKPQIIQILQKIIRNMMTARRQAIEYKYIFLASQHALDVMLLTDSDVALVSEDQCRMGAR